MNRLLMHVGPSIGNRDVLLAGARDNIGFATKDFVQAMGDSLEGLRMVMGVGGKFQPFILPGSGTSAMESVASFLHEGDRVLIITNGIFGNRWEGIFSRYRVKCDVVGAEAGESVTPDMIREKTEGSHYRMSFMTHVETSTGVRAPVDSLLKELKKVSDLITVDGVASAGGELVDAEKRGIDICLTASQKAIGAPPGAGLLVASEKAMSQLADDSLAGYSLNLKNWLPIMKGMEEGRGGYFATPPINTVFSLQEAFRLIAEETMAARLERHKMASGMLRAGIRGMGMEVVAGEGIESNTVTGLRLKNSKQKDVLEKSMKLGVEFGSGVHPGVKPDYIRIGHMGWVQEHHVLRALSVLERSLKASGESIKAAEGVKAAQEFIT
ncbi:septum site-determining protein [uncultured archaeon]|nr:septum site-determining protein [uncultured archaeon]